MSVPAISLKSEHTHFHLTHDVHSSFSHSSRIDRFYVPSLSLHSPLFDPAVSVFPHSSNYRPPSPSAPRSSFSDHLPIFLSFHTDPAEERSRRSIPLWLALSPEFESSFAPNGKPPSNSFCPFVRLAQFKAALFSASYTARKSRIDLASTPLRLSQHLERF